MGDVILREASAADAEGIARVHVDSWRETYGGVVPDHYLQNLSYTKRTENWRKMLLDEVAPWKCFVVESGGDIKGFANVGKGRRPDFPFTGELYAIYLLKEMQGQGLGKMMFDKVGESLKADGVRSMYCWVLRDNPTMGFYKRLGGQEFARDALDIGGAALAEVAMGWKEI